MKELYDLLGEATHDERVSLARLLDTDDCSVPGITTAFQKDATTFVGYRLGHQRPGYREIVKMVAEKIGLHISHLDTQGAEGAIVQKLFDTMWDKLTIEQRDALLDKANQQARQQGNPTVFAASGAAGAIVLAQASGFGVYIFASTVLGATTAGLGITLPFAVYTAMSHFISIAIGPVGWIGLALLAFLSLTGRDYARVTNAIIMVHCIRARVRMDEERARARRARRTQRAAILVGLVFATLGLAYVLWAR